MPGGGLIASVLRNASFLHMNVFQLATPTNNMLVGVGHRASILARRCSLPRPLPVGALRKYGVVREATGEFCKLVSLVNKITGGARNYPVYFDD